jgi:hypothetical protein
MEQEVRSLPEFKSKAAESFVLVKIDFPQREPALSLVKNRAANDELQRQFGITGYPTIVLTDASGMAYGSLAFQEGGVKPFLANLDRLRRVRIERDKFLAAVDEAEGIAKLTAAKRALEFLAQNMLIKSLQQQLPLWRALAERLDPRNEQMFVELFFAVDWDFRFQAAPTTGLPPLLREVDEWKSKYGKFQDKERSAYLWSCLAQSKAELEDYEGAFAAIEEGSKLEAKNPQVRQLLQVRVKSFCSFPSRENCCRPGSSPRARTWTWLSSRSTCPWAIPLRHCALPLISRRHAVSRSEPGAIRSEQCSGMA